MPKKSHSSSTHVRGTVIAFNVSPKGHVEGVLLETKEGTVQVNFPKPSASTFARAMRVGARVDLDAELETDEFDHPVYVATEANDGEATGKIVRLNYALHGELNGFHLDDGTFVHLKPEGAKKARPRIGETITARGERRTGGETVVLEAESVERPRKRASAEARA